MLETNLPIENPEYRTLIKEDKIGIKGTQASYDMEVGLNKESGLYEGGWIVRDSLVSINNFRFDKQLAQRLRLNATSVWDNEKVVDIVTRTLKAETDLIGSGVLKMEEAHQIHNLAMDALFLYRDEQALAKAKAFKYDPSEVQEPIDLLKWSEVTDRMHAKTLFDINQSPVARQLFEEWHKIFRPYYSSAVTVDIHNNPARTEVPIKTQAPVPVGPGAGVIQIIGKQALTK